MWFVFAFATAVIVSFREVFFKGKLRDPEESGYSLIWGSSSVATILLLPVIIFLGFPEIKQEFIIFLIIGGILSVVTATTATRALKKSDISLVAPMSTFTPLFLLGISPLITGEFPNAFGFFGVLLITFGSYVLNIEMRHEHWTAPFKALLKNEGPRLMLFVAFVWSITSSIDKIGVKASYPLFWVFALNMATAVFLLPFVYKKINKQYFIKNFKTISIMGSFTAVAISLQMVAISMTLVAYVIAIKRLGVVMTVFMGGLIFKEKGLKERLLGSAIMVAGVIFIAILG
ncbi:MAG: EamA family transporter [Candidatus Moranbacteria bacterium]|nr:EamA family transporter [Candidatus Moranbacteria bacterium]